MSLLGSIVQAAFEAEAARAQVQAAKAGDQIETRPLVKARIWGTRGRLGLFYIVERPRETLTPSAKDEGGRMKDENAFAFGSGVHAKDEGGRLKDEGERAFNPRVVEER